MNLTEAQKDLLFILYRNVTKKEKVEPAIIKMIEDYLISIDAMDEEKCFTTSEIGTIICDFWDELMDKFTWEEIDNAS